MEELKNSENVPDLSQKNIKTDLIHFKNDILKDVRSMKLSLAEKYSILEEKLKEKIINYDLTIKSFEQKIFELSKLITIDKTIKEKVESLCEFKEEIRDNIFKQRAKLNELENKVTKEINRINDILLDSVIYPGIIGVNSKYKNFHELMDYVMKELSEITLIKDKNGMDLRPFKKKIEQTVDAFRIQINNMYSKEMTNNAINQSEERMLNSLKLYDEKIRSIKVENFSSNLNYTNKLEELNSKLKNLEKFQKNFEFNSEVLYIKKEINNIYEILRDLFSVPEIKKEIEKKNKVYSGVRQYINGVLNAKQLSSMKKFSYGKSNSNEKNNEKSNSAKTSSFPTPENKKSKKSFDKKRLFYNNESRNNRELGLDNYYNTYNNHDTDNIFISQNDFAINRIYSQDIKEKNNMEKLINHKNEYEDKKKNIITNSENNNIFENNKLGNKIKKIYKEEKEEQIAKKLNNYEKLNPKNNIEKKENLNQFVISEEDENNLSDNANLIKEKINKVKNNNNLNNNFQNNNNISFDNIKTIKDKTELSNNNIKDKNQNNNYLRILNISRENNNDIYNKNKNNYNSLKKSKEKEYNQSVPLLEIKKEKINPISNRENIGTQSNKSQFTQAQKGNLFASKTYTSFPFLKQDALKENKSHKNSNFEKKKLINYINNNYSFILNDENIQYNYYYQKNPKKVLLVNPDMIPNFELRKNNKSANRLNSSNKAISGFRTQKNLDKIVDTMTKGLVTNKKNKLITNGGNIHTYNSLYDIITAHENTYGHNQTSKTKK